MEANAPAASAKRRIPGASLARRVWFHGGLLTATALFLLAGALALDGYGVGVDEPVQRNIAVMAFDHAIGKNDHLLRDVDRIYGVAFELPLLFVERLLDLEDSRDVYRSRHVLQHLFFLVSGIFCYALVYRLFNSRVVALLAMILFLIHPRLYAASFVNSKDAPFLGMFMISLFFIHWAFRRDSALAFLLCGTAIGLLINVRIVGVLLFAVVAGMRLLDLTRASDGVERRRVLATLGVFALFAAGTVYATWPYLWADPIDRFIESWERFARHDDSWNIFEGGFVRASEVPLRYVPRWFALTTPPVVLALGAVGAVGILARSAAGWRGVLFNTPARFPLLLMLLAAGPVLGVWLLDSLLYDAWRHMYFLYAPFLLVAAFGMRWTLSALSGRGMAVKAGAALCVAAALGATLVSSVRIHPHQNMYFNALADRDDGLATAYEMDHYGQSLRMVLEDLLDRYPDSPLLVSYAFSELPKNRLLLPVEARSRVTSRGANYATLLDEDPDFRSAETVRLHIVGSSRSDLLERRALGGYPEPVHTLEVYGAAVYTVLALPFPPGYEPHRWMLEDAWRATLAAEPAARSDFDVWLVNRGVVYVSESCPLLPHPLRADGEAARFHLHVTPADPNDLPAQRREIGFANLDFEFHERGGVVEGRCVAVATLPAYPVASVRTGQSARAPAPASALAEDWRYETVWEVEFAVGEAP